MQYTCDDDDVFLSFFFYCSHEDGSQVDLYISCGISSALFTFVIVPGNKRNPNDNWMQIHEVDVE